MVQLAKGGTRTPTGKPRYPLKVVRLPVPPLSLKGWQKISRKGSCAATEILQQRFFKEGAQRVQQPWSYRLLFDLLELSRLGKK